MLNESERYRVTTHGLIICLIKTSSGSQKTELHDVKCYKVINSKKILYYNAI